MRLHLKFTLFFLGKRGLHLFYRKVFIMQTHFNFTDTHFNIAPIFKSGLRGKLERESILLLDVEHFQSVLHLI